ncbi:MAG: acetylornithine deacetylase, partial [Gemmatimonadota bacterium]
MTASIPRGDALALTRALVAIDSRNPSLAADGPGEHAVAVRLAAVLRDWGFQVDLQDALPRRPNVIAQIGPATSGRTLLLNGHLDTVGTDGMTHPPFAPVRKADRRGGRGRMGDG